MSSTAPISAGPSLAGRFAAAIALTIGFYVLALALAAGLLALAILPWVFNGSNNIWVTLTAAFLGGSILVAIVPRRLRFEAPGMKVSREQQPRLFDLVADEAKAAGEPVPDEVYLTLEANAAVTQASRTSRVLIVGVPLLHILSEREARGVIAHEFGHYSGGDTKLGPWIYRTRETIVRTVEQLSDDDGDESWSKQAVRLPFIWYGRAFLRITASISRRQEFAADACAVRSVGRAAHVSALERIHAYAPGFDYYWDEEFAPVLRSGRRPPLADGFRRFIGHETVAQNAERFLAELRDAETDPYDSHPALAERIAAVAGMPDGEPDDSPCAIEALADAERVEHELLRLAVGNQAANFPTVRWEDVGREVYGERARALTAQFPAVLEGATLGGLPESFDAVPQLADRIDDPEIEHRYELTAAVLADGALLALEGAGWTLEAEPAAPITARRGDEIIAPHTLAGALASGELTAADWHARAERLGISELLLGAPATADVA